MIRRFGEAIRRDQTYRVRPGAYAILARHGEILLTFQEAPTPEFQLPGGGIDPGEHMLPALHREVLEETGYAIDTPKRLGAFRRFTYMPEYDRWAEKICHIFLARPTLRRSAPSEPGHTAIWLPFGEAVDLVGNDGDRHFLARFL